MIKFKSNVYLIEEFLGYAWMNGRLLNRQLDDDSIFMNRSLNEWSIILDILEISEGFIGLNDIQNESKEG